MPELSAVNHLKNQSCQFTKFNAMKYQRQMVIHNIKHVSPYVPETRCTIPSKTPQQPIIILYAGLISH